MSLADDIALSEFEEELQDLTDDQIRARVDQLRVIEDSVDSQSWKAFREVCRRLYLQAGEILEQANPIKEPEVVMEAQVHRKFYKNVVVNVMNSFMTESKMLRQEQRNRNQSQQKQAEE